MSDDVAVDLGSFTIDPGTTEFAIVKHLAEEADGYKCLIALYARYYLPGVRPFAQFGLGAHKTISVSYGGFRWTRRMTYAEQDMVQAFDSGLEIVSPVTVNFNLGDGTWKAKPKSSGTRNEDGTRKRAGNRQNKSLRKRHQEAMKQFANG